MTEALFDSITVVGVLTCSVLLHTVCKSCTDTPTMQCGIIQERILYKFEQGYNATKTFLEQNMKMQLITMWHNNVCMCVYI